MRQLEEDSASELPFPAGMGVLVVDDDSACLKLMENLLLKCHYRVTTTNRGKEALKILKENRNKFDIVISDVQMQDMDGIKLLQLVGLEMNIPVIMLSAHSDQKLVMEGIRNGACDYLVKPVRIQELQNIWQHVVRRNKSITLKRPAPSAVEIDRLKGKQRIEESLSGGDDEPETEEDDRDNEESNMKKPRLFWSVELHQKFVDAVNSLGLDKAYPKKILELMNIQGLTREKVASHLQKYRLYLRKVDEGSSQTGMNMIMNGYDDVHIDPFGGRYGVFRAYAGMNSSLSNPPTFGQLNTSAGLSIRDLASSPMLQTSQLQNSFGNFGGALPSQGFPSHPQNVPTLMNAPPPPNSIFSSQNTTQFGNQVPSSNSWGSFGNQVPSSNSWGSFGNQVPSSNSWGSFGNQVPSSNSWGSFVDPQPFQRNLFTSNTSADVIAPPMSHVQSVQHDYFYGFSSGDALKDNLPAPNNLNNAVNTFNFQGQSQTWQGQKPDNILYSSNMPASDQNLSQNNTNIGVSPLLQLEGASTQFQQQNANLVEPSIKFDDFLLDDGKFMAGSSNASGGSEYLEDIVGSFLKQDNGGTAQAAAGDDFDFDLFTS